MGGKVIGVGVVGLGFMGRTHLAAFHSAARAGAPAKVVAVCDAMSDAELSLSSGNIDTAADDLLANLIRVAEQRAITVKFDRLTDGLFGVSKGGSIDVDNQHATGQQAKTLAHELAHEALHKATREGLKRTIAELEAEAVAYVVCRHFGLDADVRASRYIALWGGDGKALRASLDRISATARTMIDDAEAQTGKVEHVDHDRKAVA